MKNQNLQEIIDQENKIIQDQEYLINNMIYSISYRDLIPPDQDRVASDYRLKGGFLQGGF